MNGQLLWNLTLKSEHKRDEDTESIRCGFRGKMQRAVRSFKACAKTIEYSMTFEIDRHWVCSKFHVGVDGRRFVYDTFRCVHCMHSNRKSFIHSHTLFVSRNYNFKTLWLLVWLDTGFQIDPIIIVCAFTYHKYTARGTRIFMTGFEWEFF